MTVRIEWGFAQSEDTFWCAARVGAVKEMVCGRRKGWMPPVQLPFDPPHKCSDCAARLAGETVELKQDDQAEGTCPVCVGRAPLDDGGRVAEHGEWSWRSGRVRVTDRPCAGVGELPEVER